MGTNPLLKWGIIGGLVIAGIVVLVSFIGIYNTQASLKNTYDMKVKDNSSEFDNMWKKINQVAQVPEEKKNALKEIFNSYAQARTSEGQGRVMSWIKEAVPNVDMSIYDHLANIIVASRDGWTMRQKELVAIAEQFNKNLVTFPKNVFLGLFGFEKINPLVITSERTEKAFESGKDDDVQLFKK